MLHAACKDLPSLGHEPAGCGAHGPLHELSQELPLAIPASNPLCYPTGRRKSVFSLWFYILLLFTFLL